MDAVVATPTLVQRLRRRFRPHRRAIPTRAGLFVLGSPLVLGIAAVSASNNLLMLLLAVALGAIVLSGILSERNIMGVKVKLRAVSAAFVGEPCRLHVELSKPAELPAAFGLQVRELAPGVWKPWGKRPRSPEIVDAFLPVLDGSRGATGCRRLFMQRGPARIPTCELITRFPFGLLNKARDVHVDLDVWVRPRRIPVPAVLEDPRRSAGEGEQAARRGLGVEIYGLRERQAWDEATRVHALRSMSLGKDVVLETAQVQRPTAWLGVANTEAADPEALERALEVAQAALTAWEDQGYAVGIAFADEIFEPGTLDLEGLLDAVARVEARAPSWGEARRLPALWLVPDGAQAPRADGTSIRVDAAGRLDGGPTP